MARELGLQENSQTILSTRIPNQIYRCNMTAHHIMYTPTHATADRLTKSTTEAFLIRFDYTVVGDNQSNVTSESSQELFSSITQECNCHCQA